MRLEKYSYEYFHKYIYCLMNIFIVFFQILFWHLFLYCDHANLGNVLIINKFHCNCNRHNSPDRVYKRNSQWLQYLFETKINQRQYSNVRTQSREEASNSLNVTLYCTRKFSSQIIFLGDIAVVEYKLFVNDKNRWARS